MKDMDQGEATGSRSAEIATPAPHTPLPWFVSGVRFRMNGGEWQSILRYDEAKKQDEHVACVGYDPRTGAGFADARFIVRAVNSHDALVKALEDLLEAHGGLGVSPAVARARAALAAARGK